MERRNGVLGLVVLVALGSLTIEGLAQVCNLKVITDGNPDYTDIDSLVRSATSAWGSPEEQCWAMWYWNHRARRQTNPTIVHGKALTDPIRQFNDYGYTMCSTVSGINCGIWHAMGRQVKYWDISNHTVPEVEYGGRYHCYDSSMSAIYTLCDGFTIAGVEEVGRDGACAASGGVSEPGHIARYHCLASTSPNGFLTGADCARDLAQEYACFNTNGLKFRYYFNDWELGHRYILNLRENESYIRYYHQLDTNGADAAYYVPNQGGDPEEPNPRYRIRGNGVWTYGPPLTGDLSRVLQTMTGLQAVLPSGIRPALAGQAGEGVFKVEGANVICSLTIRGTFLRKTGADVNIIAVSTCNGLAWQDVWTNSATGEAPAAIKLIAPVSGAYEVLVKVRLLGQAAASNALVRSISFETVTMVNSKTQPRLKLGKNTVYVGAGDQTDSIVFWPDLQGQNYKPFVVDEKNIGTAATHPGYMGVMYQEAANQETYVVFRLDAPRDIRRLTYGGRFYNRAAGSHIDLRHSFDNGQTWFTSYSLTGVGMPWDVLHDETVTNIPAGTRSVLCKYSLNGPSSGSSACSLYSVRMEANHAPSVPGVVPLEVTFTWKEAQAQFGQCVQRRHTQLVDRVPFTYAIDVGGSDHPVMESLGVNLKSAFTNAAYGYSDGHDVGGSRFQERWVTVGKVLSTGKPYTCSLPSESNWGAGDPQGKILTDGVVGPTYSGSTSYQYGALWSHGQPVVTVDLGRSETCGAFRVQASGYPFWDAMKGEITDVVEVLTSTNGSGYASQGFFNFDLRWKDLPANFLWNQDETITGHNFELIPPQPVQARYVQFKMTPTRFLSVSEVQVLDFIRYEPFDLRVALPIVKPRQGTVFRVLSSH